MKQYISYTMLITILVLVFSCQVHYVSQQPNARNLNVSDSVISADPTLTEVFLPYKTILEKDMARVISYAEADMIKDKPESLLTNFLADLLLEEAKIWAKQKDLKDPSISYFNYGGIRTSIPKGNITVGKIFELMPFENEMVFVKLSGKQIRDFADIIASKGGDSVGGLTFTISDEKAENILVGGRPIDNQLNYWVVTNDYIANGGDGLQIFNQRVDYVITSIKIRDVIISYLEKKQDKGEKILVKLDQRIVVKN